MMHGNLEVEKQARAPTLCSARALGLAAAGSMAARARARSTSSGTLVTAATTTTRSVPPYRKPQRGS